MKKVMAEVYNLDRRNAATWQIAKRLKTTEEIKKKNGAINILRWTQDKNGETEIAWRSNKEDNLDRERLKSLVVEKNHKRKDIHAWIKRETIEAKSKMTREVGLQNNRKDWVGYRKL